VARVKAVLRRGGKSTQRESPLTSRISANPEPPPLKVGPLTIDPARREARLGPELLELRTKEFDLLQTFVENKGLALSREKLLDLVWGYDFYGETRTVDVHVAHLRDKLGADERVRIDTVWGFGYKFVYEA